MTDFKISGITIYRLGIYARALERFIQEGRELISSEELARACGVNSAQLRKDLSYFGQFGVRGVGYSAPGLLKHIRRILGTDREWPMILAGVGNLGRALLSYDLLSKRGFRFVAAFEVDEKKIGQVINHVYVYSIEQLPYVVREHQVEIGVIATPSEAAQEVADRFIKVGIRGILNFASTTLQHPQHVVIENSDITILFDKLAYYVLRLR